MRLSSIAGLLVLFFLFFGVYAVADKVQLAEKKQARFESKISDEHENLRVLHAEWTFLTNPDRLQKISNDHFQMVPTEGQYYVELAAIPMRDFIEKQEMEKIGITSERMLAQAAPKPVINETNPVKEMVMAQAEIEAPTEPALTPVALPQALPLPTLTATPISAVSQVAQ